MSPAAGDEDPAPADGGFRAPGGQIREVGRDQDARVGVLVPHGQRALQDLHAVALGPRLRRAGVGVLHVQAGHDDVPGAHRVAREYLHLADRAQPAEFQGAQALHGGVVEQGPRGRRRLQP